MRRDAKQKTKYGVLYFGSTAPSMHEALGVLEEQGVHLNAMRVRGFPFSDAVFDFIAEHERVFVVKRKNEQMFASGDPVW